jgi:predicted nucleic acid-binding protein
VSLVLDTGPILALLDAGDPRHRACVRLVEERDEALVVPAATLVEVDYWCRKLLGPDVFPTFVEDIARGAYRLVGLDPRGCLRAAELGAQYRDLRLGLVDASVVVTCELLGETKVATLDRRRFAVVTPAHCPALELLP